MTVNPKTGADNLLKKIVTSPAGRAFLALLLVLIIGAIFNADGAFFKIGTHRDTLRQASVYGILACGMTLVIISGGIDLSVGSVLALVAVCCAQMAIHWNWSAWLVAPALPAHRRLLRRWSRLSSRPGWAFSRSLPPCP